MRGQRLYPPGGAVPVTRAGVPWTNAAGVAHRLCDGCPSHAYRKVQAGVEPELSTYPARNMRSSRHRDCVADPADADPEDAEPLSATGTCAWRGDADAMLAGTTSAAVRATPAMVLLIMSTEYSAKYSAAHDLNDVAPDAGVRPGAETNVSDKCLTEAPTRGVERRPNRTHPDFDPHRRTSYAGKGEECPMTRGNAA